MPKNSDNKSFVFYLLTKLTKIFIIGIYSIEAKKRGERNSDWNVNYY